MNILNTSDEVDFQKAKTDDLLGMGLEALRGYSASVDRLSQSLTSLAAFGNENTERRFDRMKRQLADQEPSITMIGQIKSGKTSLVNALIGCPDLLPADVNPWTSVVTSLHLNPESPEFENSASFRFFDEDEWDRLISGGGRIGELASRAGADEELEKIKQQVAEMREKSRVRLGRKFEVLLGQERDYGYFDKELIERYVCLGEEPEDDEDQGLDTQGRFADITKSADLHMTRAALPMRLCIRDTPGVNDTFMMREQITIRAIRDSRICTVVLSAHQALSSSDMALIRLISNAKSREIIIFVNRIDELSDPKAQIQQIKTSIEATLKKHKGPTDAEIIFGSALWASSALRSRLDELPSGSALALRNYTSCAGDVLAERNPAVAWKASGIPALQHAIAQRVVDGTGAATLHQIGVSAKNLAKGLVAADRIGASSSGRTQPPDLSPHEARELIETLCRKQSFQLNAAFDGILASFSERLERVQESFLDRATASLVAHLEKYGEMSPWTYDPAGLRVLLSSSHKVLARNSTSAFNKAVKEAAVQIADTNMRAFALGEAGFEIEVPRAPTVPSPVTLGRTIALDLNASWWKRWWLQRRGYQAYSAQFFDLIKSEITPLVSELKDDLAQRVKEEALSSFEVFLNEQLSVFETLERMQNANPQDLRTFVAENSPNEKQALFEEAMKTLDEYTGS